MLNKNPTSSELVMAFFVTHKVTIENVKPVRAPS